MLDYKPNVVLSNTEYKVLGTRPIRHDGLDKVTGRAQYAADIPFTGLLHGRILRSTHAHARIRSIDPSRALALPGVKAVVTTDDFSFVSDRVVDVGEGQLRNLGFLSANCLARGKVLYNGQAVAAVAATSPHIAEEALALIDVDYEVLPAVFTAQEAMKEGAPILHELLLTSTVAQGPGGTGDPEQATGTNVSKHFEHRLGDVEKGFAEADAIVEGQYHTVPVHQGYLESHVATALWDRSGRITIWSSTQGQFSVREQTAAILGVPVSTVRVFPTEIGGGFGGKLVIYVEPVAAALSRKTGQPVRVSMTRQEVFTGSGPTSGGDVKVKIGATKDGRITAAQAELVYVAGAFPGSPVAGGARCMFAPYDISNAYVDAYDVVVNTPKVGAYRGPGAPISAFAAEQAIDELCGKLGMDPIEFRLLNGAREGTRQATGPVFGPIGYLETLRAAQEHPHYSAPLGGPNRGRGVATGYWGNGGGPSSAIASVNPDGTVSLVEGSPDLNGSRVSIAMQFAEALGIPVADVTAIVADTDSIGFTSQSGGSSVTYKTGWACYEAAQDIKRQMAVRAAQIWEVPADAVEFQDGVLRHASDTELRMTFQDLAARLLTTGGPIVGRATTNERRSGPGFATHIVDVEVDPETGKVGVLRYTAIQDAGKAIHPDYVEGQMQGGAAQGIGWAISEEYYVRDGKMLNSSFLDYRMPTSLDVPMIDTVIVEVPHGGHPYGVRGVAELAIIPPMGAIANAVSHAIGVRMTELPMSPARVLEALWGRAPGHDGGGG